MTRTQTAFMVLVMAALPLAAQDQPPDSKPTAKGTKLGKLKAETSIGKALTGEGVLVEVVPIRTHSSEGEPVTSRVALGGLVHVVGELH